VSRYCAALLARGAFEVWGSTRAMLKDPSVYTLKLKLDYQQLSSRRQYHLSINWTTPLSSLSVSGPAGVSIFPTFAPDPDITPGVQLSGWAVRAPAAQPPG